MGRNTGASERICAVIATGRATPEALMDASGYVHRKDLAATLCHLRKKERITYERAGREIDWSTLKLVGDGSGASGASSTKRAPSPAPRKSGRRSSRATAREESAPASPGKKGWVVIDGDALAALSGASITELSARLTELIDGARPLALVLADIAANYSPVAPGLRVRSDVQCTTCHRKRCRCADGSRSPRGRRSTRARGRKQDEEETEQEVEPEPEIGDETDETDDEESPDEADDEESSDDEADDEDSSDETDDEESPDDENDGASRKGVPAHFEAVDGSDRRLSIFPDQVAAVRYYRRNRGCKKIKRIADGAVLMER